MKLAVLCGGLIVWSAVAATSAGAAGAPLGNELYVDCQQNLAHLIHRISRSRIDSEQAMEPGAPHPRQGDPHFSPYLSGARG